MTEEKDGPVHYQVSVTGRQAAAFFLVLLAALGLSFFFGMKTGAAAKRGPDPISALTAQSDIQVRPAADGEAGEKAIPVPTEAPLGFEATAPAPARESAAKAEPAAVAKEDRSPAPEPKVVELAGKPEGGTPEKSSSSPVPAKETAKKDEGPYWVQILVTSSPRKADELSKRLKAEGFKPDVSLVPGKKDLFRIRVGTFPDRAKAEDAAKRVEKAEKLQTKPIVVPGK